MGVVAAGVILAGAERPAAQQGIAFLSVDLKTHMTLSAIRPDLLDRPIAPGSVIKIATIAAAIESGLIDARSGIICNRTVIVAGHRLTCTHPDLHRPLTPAEALAHSCNVYVASVAARLPRPAFDRALSSLGLTASDPAEPVVAAAVGVEGVRATPRQLVELMARVGEEPSRLPWRPSTLAVIREGLRGAAHYGTASVLAEHGVDAMAKTGTIIARGISQGVVAGVTPAIRPTTGFVVVASGASGADAASFAAGRLSGSSRLDVIRIGISQPDGRFVVRALPIDEYVAGVVTGEAARGSAAPALAALAITVRTFALANAGRHAADGFDLCDLTHCQAFRKSIAAATRAAEATSGRVLLSRGSLASVFYSASCGGHTEHPSAVWPGAADPSYLPSRADDACGGEPAWTSDIAAGDLARALRSGGFGGDTLRDVQVIGRTASGRVARLRLDGFTPGEVSGEGLRTLVGRTLGWNLLKSTAFDLRRTGSGFHVTGRGLGHGVGLCVIGSARLADRGATAEQILSRYFPGLQIGAPSLMARSPDVIVDVSAGDEGSRDAIHALALRTRDRLAARLGMAPPPHLTLRFHPTVESYQRATRQPWFTAATAVGDEIHFVPLAVLRKLGSLERTLAHEIVHVLTRDALSGRPRWVVEGAATYFAGEIPPSDSTDGSCPTDHDLQKPTSAGAMGTAYGRAAACFAREITSGKAWQAVR